MYLFRPFHSFLPLRNPIGLGVSDFLIFSLAVLLVLMLVLKAWLGPAISSIAQRTYLCMGLLFVLPILLRIALLAQSPVPVPSGADDFSYLLLGDTLRHWRMANTPHPLQQFFEAVFVLQNPSYASIYPLGQGLLLVCGWAGVLISSGAFCALCYWMLRAWVLPTWALAGGLLAVIEFGPLNSWVNSYWGGLVSACAGCLVFGALPRLRESPKAKYGVILGAGLGLQLLSRPFESLFLGLAAALYITHIAQWTRMRADKGGRNTLILWLASLKPSPSYAGSVEVRPLLAAAGVVAAALGLMMFQNKAVTHSWTTMPYMLSRYQYGVPATFTFQENAVPHRQLTPEQELDYKAQAAIHGAGTDSLSDYWQRLVYRFRYLRFFLLPPLYFALIWYLPVLRERRYIWASGTVLLFVLGTNFYAYFFPHYIAAVACLFVLFSVVGLARMSLRIILPVCGACFLFWYGLYLYGDNDLLRVNDYQSWNYINRGDPQSRARIAAELAASPGWQLVFVRYSPAHRFQEWVHNAADIDAAQTVWANDLGTEENQKLLDYYPHRKTWLLEPDAHPPALTPYLRDSGEFLTVH